MGKEATGVDQASLPPAPPPAPGTDFVLMPALRELTGHLLWRAVARKRTVAAEVLPAGLDVHAYAALRALDSPGTPDGPASRTQQQLARATGVSRTTMASVASLLAAGGLVERVRNPSDRRSYALVRTSSGTRAVTDWAADLRRLGAGLAAGLSTEEQTELSGLLHELVSDELPTDLLPELHHTLGFLVGRAHARMHRELLEALTPWSLEPRQFGLLSILDAAGPITQAELSRYIGVSGPTVVQMVDDLQALGLIERRRAPEDRRLHLLHMLMRAQELLPRAAVVAHEVEGSVLAGLAPQQRDRLRHLLARLVTGT